MELKFGKTKNRKRIGKKHEKSGWFRKTVVLASTISLLGGACAHLSDIDMHAICLRDKDCKDRSYHARVLGKTGNTRAIHVLIYALKDKKIRVRRNAVKALGCISEKNPNNPVIAWVVVPALIKMLKDKSRGVRSDAAEELAKIGNPKAIPALIRTWMDNKDTSLSLGAFVIIAKKNPGNPEIAKAVTILIGVLKESRDVERAVETLGEIGDPRAIPALINVLSSEYRSAQNKAVDALVKIGNPAIPALTKALKDRRWRVRRNALSALGYIRSAEAVLGLIGALKSNDPYLRKHALRILGEERDARLVPVFVGVLLDKNEHARQKAAEILGEIGDAGAVPALIEALKDDIWAVRLAAVNALRRIEDAKAVPWVIRILKDKNWQVRLAAVRALRWMKSNKAVSAVPTLTAIREKDPNSKVRNAVSETMKEILSRQYRQRGVFPLRK